MNFLTQLAMSTCSAFLPHDAETAADVVARILAMSLEESFPVQTLGAGLCACTADQIKERTTEQLLGVKMSGVLPTDDPNYIRFEEVGVSEAEGSTVDVLAHVSPSIQVVLRVHHGRANAMTFHLPMVRAEFDKLIDPAGIYNISSSSLVNSLIASYRTRHRHDAEAMDCLTSRLRTICIEHDREALCGKVRVDAKSEGRRILEQLARQRSESTEMGT